MTRLDQNRPNPFKPATEIPYALAYESPVTLAIYNVQGRLIRLLVSSVQPAGRYRVIWDGMDQKGTLVPSGIYMYRLTAGSTVQMRKLVLVR